MMTGNFSRARIAGFTIVELLISLVVFVFLIGFIFQIYSDSARKALKGMQAIDTVLEASRVLRQVRDDLKLLVPNNDLQSSTNGSSKGPIKIDDYFKAVENGQEARSYEWFSFCSKDNTELQVFRKESFSDTYTLPKGNLKLAYAYVVKLSKIRYFLEKKDGSPLKKLIRIELEPEGQENKRVLSERVNFFEIKKESEISRNGNCNEALDFFSITIQLIDPVIGSEIVEGKKSDTLQSIREAFHNQKGKFVVADFFDTVYPEAWNKAIQHLPENEWPVFKLQSFTAD